MKNCICGAVIEIDDWIYRNLGLEIIFIRSKIVIENNLMLHLEKYASTH
jgi:hypothetical protein